MEWSARWNVGWWSGWHRWRRSVDLEEKRLPEPPYLLQKIDKLMIENAARYGSIFDYHEPHVRGFDRNSILSSPIRLRTNLAQIAVPVLGGIVAGRVA
jgi:hypothetical protein